MNIRSNSPAFGRSIVKSVAAAIASASLFAVPSTHAASATWNLNADGSWATDANWNPAAAPGSTSLTTSTDVATFGTVINAARIITVDANRNIFGIDFAGNSSGYTLSGGNLLITNGGYIQTSGGGSTHTDVVSSGITIEGDGGGASFITGSTTAARLLSISGSVTGVSTAGNTTTLTLDGIGSGANIISGAITDGAGGGKLAIVKNGTGTWQLSNTANTFSGGLTMNGGTTSMAASGNTNLVMGSGALTMNNTTSFRFTSTSATTVNNALVINGINSFVFRTNTTFSETNLTGTGTLLLTNTNSGGSVTVTPTNFFNFAGTIDVENSGATGEILRLASAFVQTSMQNATLNIGTGAIVTQQNTVNVGTNNVFIGALSGGGSIGGSAAASGTYIYNIGGNGASTLYSGVIVNGTNATTSLTKAGAGTLTLTGANSYTGLNTLNAGTVNINGINALGGANYGGTTFNGGTLQYASTLTSSGDITQNAAAVAKNVTLSAGGATIDTNGNTVSFANSLGNSGTGALTKTGAGTLTLTAASTYTGGTVVSAGTLALTGAGSLGSGNVKVNGILDISGISAGFYGFTVSQTLSGSGTVEATGKTVNMAGVLAPGNSPGTLTINATSLTLTSTATSNFEINGTTAGLADKLVVNGNIDFDGTLSLSTGYSASVGDSVDLFDFTSSSGFFSSILGTNLGGGLSWDTTNIYNTGVIFVVPEPNAAAMLLTGFGLLVVVQRSRRRVTA